MDNPAITFLTYFLEMMVAYIFFSRISERKHSVIVSLGIGMVVFGVGAVANLIFDNNLFINSFMMLLMHFMFVVLCFSLNLRSNVFFSIILCALCAALEIVPILLISALTGGHPVDHVSDMLLFAFNFTISKSLYLIMSLLLSKVLTKQDTSGTLTKPSWGMLLYPIVILVILVLFHYIGMNEPISIDGQYIMGVVSIGVLLATAILVFINLHFAEKENEFLRMRSELVRVSREKNYYDILDKQNQQLMAYAHDTKNHLAAIQSLSEDPQIQGYVAKLSNELEQYTQGCHSGNKLLDVILNRYILESNERGIQFEYDVKVCNLKDIDDMDLVTILGNLLDNAIEAAEKSEGKTVYLETALRNAYQVILIQNSSLPPKESHGHLQTSKADRAIHGFGLKNISKCLKKYNGDLHWEYDTDTHIFTVTVMIDTISHD